SVREIIPHVVVEHFDQGDAQPFGKSRSTRRICRVLALKTHSERRAERGEIVGRDCLPKRRPDAILARLNDLRHHVEAKMEWHEPEQVAAIEPVPPRSRPEGDYGAVTRC